MDEITEKEENGTIIIERPMTKEEKAERAKWEKERPEREKAEAKIARFNAYVRISDPIYMMAQRGLKTEQDWLDAVAQVEKDYPIPGEES